MFSSSLLAAKGTDLRKQIFTVRYIQSVQRMVAKIRHKKTSPKK